MEENKIRILSEEESNSFANPDMANNGGGYHQPHYTFEYCGKKGDFYNDSCGDFGSRYSVQYDGKRAAWGTMYDTEDIWTEFNDQDFADAFYDAFGKELPLKELPED